MPGATDTRSLTGRLSEWASELRPDDVPGRVLELVKSQLLSQLACARAGLDHPLGAKAVRALGSPLAPDARQAACALAGLTGWLSFDDSAYGGHLSHSTVNVPLALAAAGGVDGMQLLMAITVANECAARVTAAATLSEFRGQGASYTHLAGAIAARMRLEGAPARRWRDAFGHAFTMAPRTAYRGLLGSDAKVLAAATPVRAGLDACDAANAGLAGAPDILEHPSGFLASFAAVPLPRTVTTGLGRRWHTDTLSFKMRPGIPGGDAAVDCALDVRQELGPFGVDEVDEVVVHCSAYTIGIDHAVAAYMDGPRSPVSALTFCVAYEVATALLHGELTPRDFAPPNVAEPERWELAAKVRLRHEPAFTRRSRLSTAPLGEALREAGIAAAGEWLSAQGAPSVDVLAEALEPPRASFEHADKLTPARLEVRLADGRTLEREREIPLGAAGGHTRRCHRELTRRKLASCGGSSEVADLVEDLEDAPAADVAGLLEAALCGTRYLPELVAT